MARKENAMQEEGAGLAGHWRLAGDFTDSSGRGGDGENRGVILGARSAEGGLFDGRGAHVVVPGSAFQPGSSPFSVATWIHTEEKLEDGIGDLLSQYNPQTRTGFSLGVTSLSGVTSAQSNQRHLYFGIDAGRVDSEWVDCGRPGRAVYVCALTVCEGDLYAGTFEMEAEGAGHVYWYGGGQEWVDCGSPDLCNSVTSLAVLDGTLYAGVSHYRSVGSSLDESGNLRPGGKIYRYEGGTSWTDCGKLGGPGTTASSAEYSDYLKRFVGWEPEQVDGIHALATYRGSLYGIPMYHQGVFRYKGGTSWEDCGGPGVRTMALGVFDGHLYAAGNEGNKRGGVYRYDGEKKWTRTGDQPGVDQVYAFSVYGGKLYVGTWPDARVFRYDGGETWADCGKLGDELEVMGMAVYNGKMYGGTLPLAEVYRYDGEMVWTRTGQLDQTPDVRYRRAWSMAVYNGKLFCGTLPSGHVFSLCAGACVTYDRELTPGWRHVVAVRNTDRLRLYVDGEEVAVSGTFDGVYDLKTDQALQIGAGPADSFNGRIRDVRVYNRVLGPKEVKVLATR
ncbi:MAG: LamG domain-containing protein [bacterium]|nr:LamG domain-containing protein [bacterium]